MDTNNFNQPDPNQQYNPNPQYDPNQAYQNGYVQQPYPVQGGEEPMSVGEWMITMLLMILPCINIIMLFVWAFGSGSKQSKSNFAKAYLIWLAIGIVLSILFSLIFGATFAAMMAELG